MMRHEYQGQINHMVNFKVELMLQRISVSYKKMVNTKHYADGREWKQYVQI